MPKDISSPFTPGQPVPAEFFIGRLEQIRQLRDKAARAANGRLAVAFLHGERGIGKSSLASFARLLSEREDAMLGVHCFLGGVNSLEEMVRRIFDRLLKESINAPWHEKVKTFFGNHIREVGLFGISVEFGAPAQELRRMVHDFAPALRNLVEKIQDEKKGIFLVLDDINGLSSSQDFANWLKSLVDEIATSQKLLPLCLLLVGLEERRQSLIRQQPSLARVFDMIEIPPWSENETQKFFNDTFARVSIQVEDKALGLLSRYAGGLPVLAHEIGEAAFSLDTDGRIDIDEAVAALLKAADVIGHKHLEPQVFQSIRSPRYRTILRKIAGEQIRSAFTRAEMMQHLTHDHKRVFDNFLRKMQSLGVIVKDPERGMGAYRFSTRLHSLYFWLEANRAKESR